MRAYIVLTNGEVIMKDVSKGTVEFINSHRDDLFSDVRKVVVADGNNDM